MASRNVLETSVLAGGIVQADPARQMCQWLRARPVGVILMPSDDTPVMRRLTEQLVMSKTHWATEQL